MGSSHLADLKNWCGRLWILIKKVKIAINIKNLLLLKGTKWCVRALPSEEKLVSPLTTNYLPPRSGENWSELGIFGEEQQDYANELLNLDTTPWLKIRQYICRLQNSVLAANNKVETKQVFSWRHIYKISDKASCSVLGDYDSLFIIPVVIRNTKPRRIYQPHLAKLFPRIRSWVIVFWHSVKLKNIRLSPLSLLENAQFAFPNGASIFPLAKRRKSRTPCPRDQKPRCLYSLPPSCKKWR